MATLTDEQFAELLNKVKLSDDLRDAPDSNDAEVAELLDLKLAADFDGNGFKEGLEEVNREFEAEIRKLADGLVPRPENGRDFMQAIQKDSSTFRHVQNLRRGLNLIKKIRNENDFDEGDETLIDVCNLMLVLARVRVQVDVVPLVARGLYASQVKDALAFWEQHMDSEEGRTEATWQKELAKRPQILSRLLGGHVVLMGEQQHVGGTGLDGGGERITDYILRHQITTNVTLIEIKTPQTALLGPRYRNTYPLSSELSGSLSQVLLQRNLLMKNYYSKHYGSSECFGVDAVKCVVIAGFAKNELTNDSKASAFEMQRDALSSKVRLVTFDELYDQFAQFNRA